MNVLIILFLFVSLSFTAAGQNLSHVEATKAYIQFLDSVWLREQPNENDESEISDRFDIGAIFSISTGDTLKKWMLRNIKGDTIYFVTYHDTREKDVAETYYLKNKQVIAARLDFKKGETRYQRTIYYQNNRIVFEDSLKVTQSVFERGQSVPVSIGNFKHLKEFYDNKKENLLSIAARYFADNYTILEKYSSPEVGFLAQDDSFESYFFDLPTVIHEGYHDYSRQLKSKDSFHFWLNDTLSIGIPWFKSFPAIVISDMVPNHFRGGRLNPYINVRNGGTQVDGFLGILEEYVAYFQGLKTYTGSFYFLKDSFQFENPTIWLSYLNRVSYVPAINEFKLFISWYLQYTKEHDAVLFQRIVENRSIKQLFNHIEKESQQLIDDYLLHRFLIVRTLKLSIEKAEETQRAKYEKLFASTDVVLKELIYTDDLLKRKEHQILDLLRH